MNPTKSGPIFDLTPPTVEEWRAARIEEIAATAETPTFFDQSTVLRAAETEARDRGEASRASALGLAADVMSMMLKTDDGETALYPILIMDGRSSARVDAFTHKQIEVLREVAGDLQDPEMRARFADLLWSRRPEERWARMAAVAYLDSLRRLEGTMPPEFADRLNRALMIARALRRDPAPLRALADYVENLIEQPSSTENRWILAKVAEIALRHKVGDVRRIYNAMMAEAERLESSGDVLGPARYYDVASRCARESLKDVAKEELAIRKHAQCVLAEAARFENGDPTGALIAASRYEDAIHIYRRRARSFDGEIKALQLHLLELQKRAEGVMARIEVEMPVPQEVRDFVEATRGLPIAEALHRIALQAAPGDPLRMRESIRERHKDYVLLSLFRTRLVKEEGKTDAMMDPLPLGQSGPEAEAAYEARITQEVFRDRTMSRETAALLLIEPMRRIITEENDVQAIDFSALFENNAFVPEDRRQTFYKGFIFGLMGDYAVATSLLVPQIENSIRHLMRADGLSTSKFDKDGIQDEVNIVQLLTNGEYRPDVDRLLGERFSLELEGLLVSRYGSNLRNRLAHGLLNDAALAGSQACYAWALALLLLLRFLPSAPGGGEGMDGPTQA